MAFAHRLPMSSVRFVMLCERWEFRWSGATRVVRPGTLPAGCSPQCVPPAWSRGYCSSRDTVTKMSIKTAIKPIPAMVSLLAPPNVMRVLRIADAA